MCRCCYDFILFKPSTSFEKERKTSKILTSTILFYRNKWKSNKKTSFLSYCLAMLLSRHKPTTVVWCPRHNCVWFAGYIWTFSLRRKLVKKSSELVIVLSKQHHRSSQVKTNDETFPKTTWQLTRRKHLALCVRFEYRRKSLRKQLSKIKL